MTRTDMYPKNSFFEFLGNLKINETFLKRTEK